MADLATLRGRRETAKAALNPAPRPNWFFPFHLKALAWHTAPHVWNWQHTRHTPRGWRLLRSAQFAALNPAPGHGEGVPVAGGEDHG